MSKTKSSYPGPILLSFFAFTLLIPFLIDTNVWGQLQHKIAVLPFTLHMTKPADHLSTGLQEMLATRLAAEGFAVVDPATVREIGLRGMKTSDLDLVRGVAKERGIDWVIYGSLSQIGEGISLDLTIISVAPERSPFSVFVEGKTMDKVADVIERAAARVVSQVKGIVQIDSIYIKGNKRIETDAILAVIESQSGRAYDPSLLDKDLKSIYQMGYFEDVQIDVEDGLRGKVVTFKVNEKPSIGKIAFEGNKNIDQKDLMEVLGIKQYAILNMKEVKDSIERLKDHYHEKRYYNVEINEKIEDLPNNEVSLTYKIKEGERASIRKIAFVGNVSFGDDELKDAMETSERGFFSFITNSGHLDSKKLENDIFKLTSFYHNHGYIKAKVGEPEISYKRDEDIRITITINEGPQYTINKVSIEGDLIKDVDELYQGLKIIKEKVYNREVIRADTLRLSEIYADEGYAFVDIASQIKESDEEKTVDVTYRISKGKKVRFERITISGNEQTRDKVIRRELQVIEGGYFSGKKLKRSSQNLYRLGFFDEVEMNTKKGSSDDQMVLDVHVNEMPTGMLSFGVGYSSVEKTMAMVELSKNNLFGLGQLVSAKAYFSSVSTRYSLSFTEPWLFGKPISGGIEIYDWEYEYDEYTKRSKGGKAKFGFPLGIDFTKGSIIYTYDDSFISDVSESASQEVKDVEGSNITSSLTPIISRDSRDRYFNARRGSVNSLSVEYAGGVLGGDNYFTKYILKSARFFPIFEDSSFSVQGRWGYAKRRPGGKLPIYEKFELGGMNTVRGFSYGSISIIDPVSGDNIGGEKMMVYNFEFRFPIQKEQGVVGVLFFDAGNVFSKDDPLTFEGIRMSAGTGIRWYTPIGPLRLEWGYNLNRKKGEDQSDFEFTIGTAF